MNFAASPYWASPFVRFRVMFEECPSTRSSTFMATLLGLCCFIEASFIKDMPTLEPIHD